jgi:urease accessory protein
MSLILLSLCATTAFAHPGHEGHVAASLGAGFAHPFTGLDHLLAMVAVGVWSALLARTPKEALRMPLAFVLLMLVGAALGLAGVHVPAVEPMIAASLLVIGLLVVVRASMPAWASLAIVGGFALFHGFAHGAELPSTVGALPGVLAYVGGFAAATALLHVAGIGLGMAVRRRADWLARASGAGVALYGVGLLMQAGA